MSTGYGWEGIGRYVRRCLVRAMYLSASDVAVSILGALYTSVRPLPYLPLDPNFPSLTFPGRLIPDTNTNPPNITAVWLVSARR